MTRPPQWHWFGLCALVGGTSASWPGVIAGLSLPAFVALGTFTYIALRRAYDKQRSLQ